MLQVGDRVRLKGDHPWRPRCGIVIRFETVGPFGLRPRVRLDEAPDVPAGQEVYVMDDSQAVKVR